MLARVLLAEQRYAEAMQVMKTVGTQSVPFADFVRGDLLARSGQIEEGKAAFAQEIRNFPGERQPYGRLAVLHWLQGDRAGAEQILESLIRANPRREAFLFAARTLTELGDREGAAAYRARAGSLQ